MLEGLAICARGREANVCLGGNSMVEIISLLSLNERNCTVQVPFTADIYIELVPWTTSVPATFPVFSILTSTDLPVLEEGEILNVV